MSKKLFAVRLPEKVISKVKNLAELEGISQAVLVENAIGLYLSTKLNVKSELYPTKRVVIQRESE